MNYYHHRYVTTKQRKNKLCKHKSFKLLYLLSLSTFCISSLKMHKAITRFEPSHLSQHLFSACYKICHVYKTSYCFMHLQPGRVHASPNPNCKYYNFNDVIVQIQTRDIRSDIKKVNVFSIELQITDTNKKTSTSTS
jgi:uncharacterized metal-binding protein